MITPLEELPPEPRSAFNRRLRDGFYDTYLKGVGLDIGFRGGIEYAKPITTTAIGIELEYAGYNGVHLPFLDESQDFVFASHILEHVPVRNVMAVLTEWQRVLKVGGHMIICVPHKYLYEKKRDLPSRYNADHRQFFTPSLLLRYIENTLEPNTYRVRVLHDCDDGFDYSIPPESHSCGEYQIEMVLQKITPPTWEIE